MQHLTGGWDTDTVVPAATRLIWATREHDDTEVAASFAQASHLIGNEYHALHALALVLAAMCPDDRSPADLLQWRANPHEYHRLRIEGVSADAASRLAADQPPRGGVHGA